MAKSEDAKTVAKRVNGILKQEFMIEKFGNSLKQKKELGADALGKYNSLRPHYFRGYLTPNQIISKVD